MNFSDHFDEDSFRNQLGNLIPIYKEQIPASIFMALIGFVAAIAWIISPETSIGTSASNLITSLLEGVGLIKVILITTISILLVASILRFAESSFQGSPSLSVANCAVRGFSSFFVPICALISVLSVFMLFALGYATQEKLKLLGITPQLTFMMVWVGFVLFFMPGLMLLLSGFPLLARSNLARTISFIMISSLWFIAFFDALK